MSDRKGCSPVALFRRPTAGALPDGARLPPLRAPRFHATDRPALLRAQTAAQRAQTALLRGRSGTSDLVIADLCAELARVLGAVHDIGLRLAQARGFLARNRVEDIARERAELEMRGLEAAGPEVAALKSAEEALGRRSALAVKVQRELTGLVARLTAAGHEIEAFCARIEAQTDSGDLAHELLAYQQSAGLALDAFEETRAELSSG